MILFKEKKKQECREKTKKKIKSIYEVGGPLASKKQRPKNRLVRKPEVEIPLNVVQGLGPIISLHNSAGGLESNPLKQCDEENHSAGMVLCSDPISDSDMIHCKYRF